MMSKEGKNYRLLSELQYHMRMESSTDRRDLRLSYIPAMRSFLQAPLIKGAHCIHILSHLSSH